MSDSPKETKPNFLPYMLGGLIMSGLSCAMGFLGTSAAMDETPSTLYIVLSLVFALVGLVTGVLLATKKQVVLGTLLILLNIVMPFIGILIPMAQSMQDAFG